MATVLNELTPLLKTLRVAGYRLPVLLQGQQSWAISECERWVIENELDSVLWVSDKAPADAWRLPANKINHELGRESDAVIFDMYSGLNVDALASSAGTIRKGGCFILICPPVVEWPQFRDPFASHLAVEPFGVANVRNLFLIRFSILVQNYAYLANLNQNGSVVLPLSPQAKAEPAFSDTLGCCNQQQRKVVDAVVTLMSGKPNKPVVVEADRGRGKSAALGIAAHYLQKQGKKVLVTAPRPQAAETLLGFAEVPFFAPDQLLQTLPNADLLIVDEAAAIAPNLLTRMVNHYPRVALATTIHGYEGTGRGFEIRFKPFLDQCAKGWKCIHLNDPVRWSSGDWLERFIDQTLLFDIEGSTNLQPISNPSQLTLNEFKLNGKTWSAKQEEALSIIFDLLVNAHYRTRPNDLRTLLDGANIRTFTLQHGDRSVAVAMIAEEGGIPDPLAQQIMVGKRRPKGQNLPQTLAVHCHQPQAMKMKLWRVVRIAVEPEFQSQGIGSAFLKQLKQQAIRDQVDVLGSVFSADAKVLRFWHSNQFSQLRVGYTAESTTGSFTSVVVKGLSQAGVNLEHQALRWFSQDFPHLLLDTHKTLPTEEVVQIYSTIPASHAESEMDNRLVQDYLSGSKVYENIAPTLWRWIWARSGTPLIKDRLTLHQQNMVVMRVLQKADWRDVIERLNLTGIKQARALLLSACAELYE